MVGIFPDQAMTLAATRLVHHPTMLEMNVGGEKLLKPKVSIVFTLAFRILFTGSEIFHITYCNITGISFYMISCQPGTILANTLAAFGFAASGKKGRSKCWNGN